MRPDKRLSGGTLKRGITLWNPPSRWTALSPEHPHNIAGHFWGEYAQRDSSLWNPIAPAITIWLVRDSACRSFGLYLLVLRGTVGGIVFAPGWRGQYRPLAIRPGKAGQSRSLPPARGVAAQGGQKGAADEPPPLHAKSPRRIAPSGASSFLFLAAIGRILRSAQ